MNSPWLRIESLADEGAPFVAMFEPTGMTYNLAGGERMFADISGAALLEDTSRMPIFRVVNWEGGISIWAPGSVITRDAESHKLHELN